ncbi:hypothetical protein BLOT_003018 [Blomia tropicalis]|nr:hypothetical protein BLOT_003018 [Blomia tropicalis]
MLIKLNCLKGIELKIRSYEASVKVSIQLGSSKTILRIEKTMSTHQIRRECAGRHANQLKARLATNQN